ncbi:MAG: nucleotidyl transferase AbiEii/AbiGii toxin family protein [Pirellulaceae bacterium]|nr:nucleotidyl transferase AbiEii/AbiGii toxin family protein [Pirellulaceae bacterium]
MDDFARLPGDERRPYFEETAARLGMSSQFVEKDFWVCWTLNRLFALDEFRDHLTFKGGTSLSKVYRVIERFSEDVDVAIDRDFLGFGGDREPEAGVSGKEQQRRVADLQLACRATIWERLEPAFRHAIGSRLDDASTWKMVRDPSDPDDQSLLFTYPPAITGGLNPYISQSIKIELGARSDHFPSENASVDSYLADVFPDFVSEDNATVRVLSAERTFWEKATILHSLHYQPEKRQFPARMSRHYYDVFRLARSEHFARAMEAIDLLERVARHKAVFFKSAWARYEFARPGTLRLSPAKHIVGKLKQDYVDMEPMFFGNAPPFEEILDRLSEIEDRVNR